MNEHVRLAVSTRQSIPASEFKAQRACIPVYADVVIGTIKGNVTNDVPQIETPRFVFIRTHVRFRIVDFA